MKIHEYPVYEDSNLVRYSNPRSFPQPRFPLTRREVFCKHFNVVPEFRKNIPIIDQNTTTDYSKD